MKLNRDSDNIDIDALKDQIISYQQLLKEAVSKSNEPVDLSGKRKKKKINSMLCLLINARHDLVLQPCQSCFF